MEAVRASAHRANEVPESDGTYAALVVDEVVGQLLAAEGFSSVEELALVDERDVADIEGFDEETARELHLNRQTLYNRLARIGELLGTDLDDPQTVLALSLALRARRLVP